MAGLRSAQSLFQVGDDVRRVLDADGDADKGLVDAQLAPHVVGDGLVGLGDGIGDQVSVPPRLSAKRIIFTSESSRWAVSSLSSSKEIIPPKPVDCFRFTSYPGWSSKPT